MALHTPERQQDESQAEYRARQRASRHAAALTPTGAYTPSKLTPKHRVLLLKIAARRANTGQRPKFAKPRKRQTIDTRKPRGFVIHAPQVQRSGKKPSFHNDAIRERGHAKLMRFFGA